VLHFITKIIRADWTNGRFLVYNEMPLGFPEGDHSKETAMGSPAQKTYMVGDVPEFKRLWQAIRSHMREIDFELIDERRHTDNVICLTGANELEAVHITPAEKPEKPEVYLT